MQDMIFVVAAIAFFLLSLGGGGDRQTTADDARSAHHVLDCERRGQVFRDHSRNVCGDISRAECAERHATANAAVGGTFRRYF